MNWIDMAYLKIENIKNDRIVYVRAKTNKEYSIKIIEPIASILSYYIAGKNENDYIFPIIVRIDDPIVIRKDIKNGLHSHNERIKKIAAQLGIDRNLTSYVARHSWGSIANFSKEQIGIIQEGMGHEDQKTTQIYLDHFDVSDVDDANKRVTNLEIIQQEDSEDYQDMNFCLL